MILPFGTTSWTAERLRLEPRPGGGWEHDCPVHYAVVDESAAQRLYSPTYNIPAPTHLAPADQAAMYRFLKDRAGGLSDIWNKRQRRFIDLYFEFAALHLAVHGAEVDEMAAEFGGLFERGHWLFSAITPLPQAHIYVGGGEGASRFVIAPICLWTASGGLAIYFPGAETSGGKIESDQAKLRDAELNVLEITEADLASVDSLAAALPDMIKFFWRGEALPMGPFAGALPEALNLDLHL